MKNILKLEQGAMFMLALYLFSQLDIDWWWYLIFFLAPDLGIFGYLISAKVGAFTYNILHHKGVAIFFYFLGIYLSEPYLIFVGTLLFGHACFDRILGYGLKYSNSFNNTHLGHVGKKPLKDFEK